MRPGVLYYNQKGKRKEIKKMCYNYYEVHEAEWETMQELEDWLLYEADLASGDPWAE